MNIRADLNCNNETKYTVVWSWIQTLLGRRTLFRGRGEMEQQLNVMSSPLVLALYDIRDISFERLYITNWTVKVGYDEIIFQICLTKYLSQK